MEKNEGPYSWRKPGPYSWRKPGERLLTREDTERTLREYCRAHEVDYDEINRPYAWRKPSERPQAPEERGGHMPTP